MQKKISHMTVHEGTASILKARMYLILALTGIASILVLLFVVDPINHPLVATPLLIVIVGIVFCRPIAHVVAFNSKRLRVAYITDNIKSYKGLAGFYRDQVKIYEQHVVSQSELLFKKIGEDFDTHLVALDAQERTVRAQMDEYLRSAWEIAQKGMTNAPDDETRNEIRQRYKEYCDSHLQHTEIIIGILHEQQESSSEDFEEKIESIISARGELVEQYYTNMEQLAKGYDDIAEEWERFLQEQYR